MRKAEKMVLKATSERKALQAVIRETFGQTKLRRAMKRLCDNCSHRPCLLLPLTTKGKDCPYFKLKGAKK